MAATLIVVGVLGALLVLWAPRHTARGSEVNERAKGFREFIATAEADRMDFAEDEQIFATYLHNAMAFDCVDTGPRCSRRSAWPRRPRRVVRRRGGGGRW